MWNELERYKNHFLQWELPHIKSEEINKQQNKDFKIAQSKRDRCEFPRENSICSHSTYFDDHAQLAYGWFMLPKLMREICTDDPKVHWRALNSLSEQLLNPTIAQRALNEMDIVRKTQNAFLHFRHGLKTEYFQEIHRLLQIFCILSNYLNGAEQIAERHFLRDELYLIVQNEVKYNSQVSKILRNLSEKPKVLLYLLEKTDAFEQLAKVFVEDACKPNIGTDDLWMHLSHFLEIAPMRGIELGIFDVVVTRIKGRLKQFHNHNMKCFALLLRCDRGQQLFDTIDGVREIYRIFFEKELDNYEYTVSAFLQGIQSKKALWRVREFTDIPSILVGMAKSTTNDRLQLYCLQALRQIGEMPCMKNYIKFLFLDHIYNIKCCNKLNECNRDEIVVWLTRERFDTDEFIPAIYASDKRAVESDCACEVF